VQIDDNKWFESLSQVALAFFGGLIGALMRREASSWRTAMLGALGAGFVGLLVAKLCHAGGVSDDLTFVFVGVSGWLGAQRTIDYLERLIESKLGVRIPSESYDETNSYSPPDRSAPTMADDPAKDKS
jgi:LydA family holin superfamily III